MKLRRTNFNNNALPALSEQILEQLQNDIDEAINTKPIMKVRINRQTVATSGNYGTTVVPLNNIEINNDNEQEYLKINNNAIEIGQGVELIRVVAFTRGLAYNQTNLGDKEFILRKNGQNAEGFYQRFANEGYGYWGAVVPTILQVNQGDKIDIILASQTPGNTEILEGFLQVEVVKGD
mgnify:CR=1 FL=1